MRSPLKTYDFFSSRRRLLLVLIGVLTLVPAFFAVRLGYSEDINDFLPLNTSDRQSLSVYQAISGAEDIYVIFDNPGDRDKTVEAMERFCENVRSNDTQGWFEDLSPRVDSDQISALTNFIYDNAPYFLTAADYSRMDSLMRGDDFVRSRLENCRNTLMMPGGSVMADVLRRDPLSLFAPLGRELLSNDASGAFDMYDGCIFTEDGSRALIMVPSPFGGSETKMNGAFIRTLDDAAAQTRQLHPEVGIHLTGGPAIAVGNASRIKKDSAIAISLSAILIILLLATSFASFRNILLVFLSVGWGGLFALAGMSLLCGKVSVIVIGISSVILGIAINYPLHLISHCSEVPDRRTALSQIMMPLVIGNITTVGAFLALVPLSSVALRDLGLFASLLLVGTILFVMFCLPHFVAPVKAQGSKTSEFLRLILSADLHRNPAVVAVLALVTIVLGYFSFQVKFDSDISHINYVTPAQKEDLNYFERLLSKTADSLSTRVYVLSEAESFEAALQDAERRSCVSDSLACAGLIVRQKDVRRFLPSTGEQALRLEMWKDFCGRHRDDFVENFDLAAGKAGFSAAAFAPFCALVASADTLSPRSFAHFSLLASSLFSGNVLEKDGRCYVVNTVDAKKDCVRKVEEALEGSFDLPSLNSSLTRGLSDNFNYIGWVCSLIVFFFLWFSFGSIEMALISFIPMAVSWLWILGIMALLGIDFNIVNIILATFIFGQGDDYTIFVTEGCQYEYATRKPMLLSYKKAILQSALIMFAGMGTLIFAKHPAMKSLAQVTLIGMSSVVLMACVIPPLLLRWLTEKNGKVRRQPLTLLSLLGFKATTPAAMVTGRYRYKGKAVLRSVRLSLKNFADQIPELHIEGKASFDFTDDNYGEKALLLALMYPETNFNVTLSKPENADIARISADDFVKNVNFIE